MFATNISSSAHVTFNEDDFPLRQAYQPDPVPSSLFEEGLGRVNHEVVEVTGVVSGKPIMDQATCE